MKRDTERLSPAHVRNAKPGMYCDGGGLYLQARAAANGKVSKSWLFRYGTGEVTTSATGKPRNIERQMGLGSVEAVGLGEARRLAAEFRLLRKQGVDPLASRNAAKADKAIAAAKAMSFNQCAEAYIASHQAGWRNPIHTKQWRATLATYASPVFGKLPVHAVDTGLVMKALEPIWTTKTDTAGRIRGRTELVLDWATARGYRKGDNPARWKGHLDKLLPARSKVRAVKHLAALPYTELPAFMAKLRAEQGTSARALEFTILTAARVGETMGALASEIDIAGKVWAVPAARMKAGREHRVPLTEPALEIVKRQAEMRENKHLFPGDQRPTLNHLSMLTVLRRLAGRVTVHGFRSAFRTWAAERSNFPREVIEAALAHSIGSAVEQAYQRGDLFEKRRRLMTAWADYCSKAATGGTVTQLRASRVPG